MAQKITFIHAADVHLGATFKGLVSSSEEVGGHLREAVSESFDRMIDACLENQVDFLILAGDTFNEGEVPFRVQHHFIEAMEKLEKAGIMVYICMGNHDPLATWEKRLESLPENVCVFPSDEPGYFLFERHGIPLALLCGRSFETSDEPSDLTPGLTRVAAMAALGDAPFAIGVLHTGITDEHYAPCKPGTLQTSGFDYYALGHIHSQGDAGGLPAVYAGSPQGLDITENSDHGCMLVTLEEQRVPQFHMISTASVIWEQPTVDVSSLENEEELLEALITCGKALIAKHRLPVCARITLHGKSPLHEWLRAATADDLDSMRSIAADRCTNGRLWFAIDRIDDKTSAPLDLDALEKEGLLPAVVIEEARALGKDEVSLGNLLRETLSKVGLSQMAADMDMADIVDTAQNICLDALMGGER